MNLLPRIAMFLLAVVLAVDGFGATRDETLRVDGHSHTTRWRTGDEYRLRFTGGRADSCDVGWTAFNALADGELVQVQTSRVFHACRRIRRGDETVMGPGPARWLLMLPVLLMLAGAFGWIEFRGDPDDVRRPAW